MLTTERHGQSNGNSSNSSSGNSNSGSGGASFADLATGTSTRQVTAKADESDKAAKSADSSALAEEQQQKQLQQRHPLARMGDYSPQARIAILFHLSLSVGMLSGGIPALQLRGYQYLAENAHQLPRTKRGWFMYHRQKNYEAMMAFFIGGAKSAVRIMLPVLAFEATTTAIDWLRTTGASYTQIEADAAKENKTSGQVDALGRVMAGAVVGSVFATQTRLTKGSARRVMRLGIGIGLGMGLLEDAIAYFSGYPPAYLQSLLNHSERISSF